MHILFLFKIFRAGFIDSEISSILVALLMDHQISALFKNIEVFVRGCIQERGIAKLLPSPRTGCPESKTSF